MFQFHLVFMKQNKVDLDGTFSWHSASTALCLGGVLQEIDLGQFKCLKLAMYLNTLIIAASPLERKQLTVISLVSGFHSQPSWKINVRHENQSLLVIKCFNFGRIYKKIKANHATGQPNSNPTVHLHVWLLTLVCVMCFSFCFWIIFWKAFPKQLCVFYLVVSCPTCKGREGVTRSMCYCVHLV